MGKYIVTLEKEEREKLSEVIAKPSSKSEIVKRAYILLSLDENGADQPKTDEEISRDYKVGQRTIERRRKRFVEEGLRLPSTGNRKPNSERRKLMGESKPNWLL